MQPDWVLYFFLTAATSLSLPEFMTFFETVQVSLAARLLQILAGFVAVSAIALGFRENGLLASLVIFVSGYSISPILRIQNQYRALLVYASAVCLMICIWLL